MLIPRALVGSFVIMAAACAPASVTPEAPPAPQSEVRATWTDDPGMACALVMVDGVFPDPETVRALLSQPDFSERWRMELHSTKSAAVARLGPVAAESCGAIIYTRR